MKRSTIRMIPALAAILAALLLTGCGISTESTIDSTTPEGLQTFGVAVDPSSQPSLAPEISAQPGDNTGTTTGQVQTGEPDQNDQGEAGTTASASPTSGTSTTSKPTSKPSNGGNGTTNGGNTGNNGNSSPALTPPAPTSTATYEDVSKFMGKSLSDLVASEGYPARSDYDYVDEDDPSQGEIGTLYFSGFTVTTRRDDSGEIITAITPTGSSKVDPDHGN